MQRRQLLMAAPALLGPCWAAAQAEPAVFVIGHANVPRIDVTTVQRLYTGRGIEAGNVAVTAINLPVGDPVRQRFLATFLQTTEERYRAYWTVRRHVGKGAPPRELASSAEIINFVKTTPGAVAYIDAASLPPGLNVICRL